MASQLNKLSIKECKSLAVPVGKQRASISDGGGLSLVATSDGSKRWQMRYRRPGGKQTVAGLGSFDEVGLAEARRRRDEMREQLRQGIDPINAARAERQAASDEEDDDSFETVAREWWERHHRQSVSESSSTRNLRRLERFAFPAFGHRSVAELEAPDVLSVLQRVEAQGHVDTAQRLKTLTSQVMRYSIATGRAKSDPTRDLAGLIKAPKKNHYPAITEPEELGELLRCLEGYRGQPTTKAALQLAPMLFSRPGELRTATWDQFDLYSATWSRQVSKGGDQLVTPLPDQAVEILTELQRITGRSRYVFHSDRTRDRPISDNTLQSALKRIDFGGQTVAHGFRATARTLLVERLGWSAEVVEMQLGHRVKDFHGRAYNRVHWLDERRRMLQQWADWLDTLKGGSQ